MKYLVGCFVQRTLIYYVANVYFVHFTSYQYSSKYILYILLLINTAVNIFCTFYFLSIQQ